MTLLRKVILKEIRNNIWGLALIACFMLLIVGFDAIAPWPFKILIDNVLSPNPLVIGVRVGRILDAILRSRDLLGFFTVLVYFLSTFGRSLVEYLHSSSTKRIIKNITTQFSKETFRSLQTLAIGFYNKQEIGDYIYRLSYDVSAFGEFLEDGVLPLFTSSLYLIVTLTIMFLINAHLTLLSLLVLPILAYSLSSFNAYIGYTTKRSEFLNSVAFSFIEEALTHLKIIQAFSQEDRKSRAFGKRIETSIKSDVTMYRLDFLLTLLVGIVIAVSYSLIMLYGIRAVFAGTLTTGLLVVFIFYLDNLTNPLLSMIQAATVTRQSYVKIMRMGDFFRPRTHLKDTGTVHTMGDTTIRFEHVTLKTDKGKKILENASFIIRPGIRTVICGRSGSGKTSIVNLILRFIDKPTSGKITIGGIDIRDYSLHTLRKNIAYVPQEISLFNDTIRHNIVFGNPTSGWKDVHRAAQLAMVDEFVQRLPGRYHFRVGEGGNFLSGGQRQRIMLARAMLKKDAKILLFDETLSSLDVRTRTDVTRNIYELSRGKTTVIVSHVFSIVQDADVAIILRNGRIMYDGPPSRLRQAAAFSELLEEQE